VLQAMLVLTRMGRASDPRAAEAIDHIADRRGADGRWSPEGSWWTVPGGSRQVDAVDWGRQGQSEMLTLNALRILRAADSWAPRGGSIRP